MNLETLIKKYIDEGYSYNYAMSQVCQDIILSKISKSPFYNKVTIKGGIVMHDISNDIRRVTRDIDFDFIKYSLDDASINEFISKLNYPEDGLKISIEGKIVGLRQQDYHGKRVYAVIEDAYNHRFKTKIDIGVHSNFDIEQEEYCFDLKQMNQKVTLLINSREQIFTEKLKSLLRIGFNSTRYKDILDFYYLINYGNMDNKKLLNYIKIIIFNDLSTNEKNIQDIYDRLFNILNSKRFLQNFDKVKNNWLELPIDEVVNNILDFIKNLEMISV